MTEEKDADPKQPSRWVEPSFSLNNRLVLEPYITDRALKANVSSGFAMVQQKVALKGLKVLVDAVLLTGSATTRYIKKGDIAYIREELLHTQIWAQKTLECDVIEDKFIIVDMVHVEFVVPK